VKKKVTASVESRFPTTKWKTVVPPFTNLHIVKKDLLHYLEDETLNIISVPPGIPISIQLRMIVNGKAWNLPDFELKDLYTGTRLFDAASDLFRDMERIMDLHEAFYGD
jgi:hypothetical protein